MKQLVKSESKGIKENSIKFSKHIRAFFISLLIMLLFCIAVAFIVWGIEALKENAVWRSILVLGLYVLFPITLIGALHFSQMSTMEEYYFPKDKHRQKHENDILSSYERHLYEDKCLKQLCDRDFRDHASYKTQISVLERQSFSNDTFKTIIVPTVLSLVTSIAINLVLKANSNLTAELYIIVVVLVLFFAGYIGMTLEFKARALRLKKRRIAILKELVRNKDNPIKKKVYLKKRTHTRKFFILKVSCK